MRFGIIGMGKMGSNLALNATGRGHKVVVYNRSPKKLAKVVKNGAVPAHSLEQFVRSFGKRRIIFLMITAGEPVDDVLGALIPLLQKGDIVIDGGNSFYEDSMRRSKACAKRGIHFLDCGVSGGVKGARRGACMMIAGNEQACKAVRPLLKSLCVKDGFGYFGKSGGGHFVKMVHNAIEYGMIGAIAEGTSVLYKNQKMFGFKVADALEVYSHGSVIESRLINWLRAAWSKDPSLKTIDGVVPRGGTEDEMQYLERAESLAILRSARLMRVKSRKNPSFIGKVIAAIRREFGGHAVRRK